MVVSDMSEMSARLDRLEEQLAANQRRLDLLARRVLDLEEKRVGLGSLVAPLDEPFAPEEQPWSQVGRTKFFVRLAAVAFALVLALALRTLSDAGMIGTTAGMALGLAYAAALLLVGARLHGSGKAAGIVLAVCGGILPAMLVLDANVRFAVLGPVGAASVLAATVLLATAVAHRLHAPVVAETTTVAAIVAGLAAGWPDLAYPLVAALLGVAAIAAAAIHGARTLPWLEWPVLLAMLLMWFAWSFRLHHALAEGGSGAAPWAGFYVPVLALTATLHLALALRRLRSLAAPAGVHAAVSPMLTVLWAAAAASMAPASPLTGWIAAAFGACALLLGIVATDLQRRFDASVGGRAAAALAGAATAAFVAACSLGLAADRALLLWAGVAATITWLAHARRRLPTLLVAAAASIAILCAAAAAGVLSASATWAGTVVAAGITLLAGAQHRGLLAAMSATTGFERRCAAATATGVLLTAGTALFFALQAVTALVWPGVVDAWLPAVQSALLAVMAALLVLRGGTWSRDHLRVGYAALVVLGAKTAVHDLWNVRGMPLLACVLLLGITAVAAAMATRRA